MNQHWKKKVRTSLAALTMASLSSFAVAGEGVANIGAFADQTVALLGQPNYGFTSDETILVQGYYDRSQPAAQKLAKLKVRGGDLFDSLGDYSVYIAGLGGQQISEEDRIAQLAAYLEKLKRQRRKQNRGMTASSDPFRALCRLTNLWNNSTRSTVRFCSVTQGCSPHS